MAATILSLTGKVVRYLFLTKTSVATTNQQKQPRDVYIEKLDSRQLAEYAKGRNMDETIVETILEKGIEGKVMFEIVTAFKQVLNEEQLRDRAKIPIKRVPGQAGDQSPEGSDIIPEFIPSSSVEKDATGVYDMEESALHVATETGDEDADLIKRILKGIPRSHDILNWQNDDGSTALINAAYYNHPNTLKLLLDHGADHTLQDQDGDTALTVALEKDHIICVAILRRHIQNCKERKLDEDELREFNMGLLAAEEEDSSKTTPKQEEDAKAASKQEEVSSKATAKQEENTRAAAEQEEDAKLAAKQEEDAKAVAKQEEEDAKAAATREEEDAKAAAKQEEEDAKAAAKQDEDANAAARHEEDAKAAAKHEEEDAKAAAKQEEDAKAAARQEEDSKVTAKRE